MTQNTYLLQLDKFRLLHEDHKHIPSILRCHLLVRYNGNETVGRSKGHVFKLLHIWYLRDCLLPMAY